MFGYRPPDAERGTVLESGTNDLAAEILASAFADDPLFVSTLPSRVHRLAGLPLMWRGMAEQCSDTGWVDLAHRDGLAGGAAVWCDGTHPDVGWREVVRYGMLRFGVAARMRDSLRLMAVHHRISRVHHELVDEPHMYLFGLGVRPGMQGGGVGSELLDRGLARVDAAHLPAYLETNLAINARLYARKGFEVVREDHMDGFQTFYMLRPAR